MWIGFLLLCAAFPSTDNQYSHPRSPTTAPEPLIDSINRSLKKSPPEGPRSAARDYRILFTRCDEEQLRRLADGKSKSVALQARWEMRKRGSPDLLTGKDPGYPTWCLEHTGILVPLEWSATFATRYFQKDADIIRALQFYTRMGARNVIGAPTNTYSVTSSGQELHKTESGWSAPIGTEIRRSGEGMVVSQGNARIRLREPPAAVKYDAVLVADEIRCIVLSTPAQWFLVTANERATWCFLTCVDSRDGTARWSVPVWCCHSNPDRPPNYLSGVPPTHDVYLTATDRMVVVFGSKSGCYVEAFDIESGENTLRFSSNYWDF